MTHCKSCGAPAASERMICPYCLTPYGWDAPAKARDDTGIIRLRAAISGLRYRHMIDWADGKPPPSQDREPGSMTQCKSCGAPLTVGPACLYCGTPFPGVDVARDPAVLYADGKAIMCR